MMRKFPKSSAYNRRIQTSRRGIAIATALTLAAVVLTIFALINGNTVSPDLTPVSVQTPVRN